MSPESNDNFKAYLDQLYSEIDPRKEAVVYHVGRKDGFGQVAEEVRFDPETEFPISEKIYRGSKSRNVKERAYFGWKEYVSDKPKAVKTAAKPRAASKAK